LFLEEQLKNYFIQNLSLNETRQLLIFLNQNYHNEVPNKDPIHFDDLYFDLLQNLYYQKTNELIDHTMIDNQPMVIDPNPNKKRKKGSSQQQDKLQMKKIKYDQVKVQLPIWLGSMDKIQLPIDSEKICERKLLKTFGLPQNTIIKSIDPIEFPENLRSLNEENPIIFEEKLDGLSCLLEYTKQENIINN